MTGQAEKEMSQYRTLLVTALEVVTFVFSSQQGFLKAIAPPEEASPSYLVGIVSFLVLIILLIISAIGRSKPGQDFRRGWIIAGSVFALLALPGALLYPDYLRRYTWRDAQHIQHLQGTNDGLTPLARGYMLNHPDQSSPEQLSLDFDQPEDIWTKESLTGAGERLRDLYAWLVITLAASIFCLLEANSSPAKPNRRRSSPSVKSKSGSGSVLEAESKGKHSDGADTLRS